MTVRVGTSVVAGSGADAQEVNALIESVNSLVEEVKALKEKLQSGSIGGSGSGGVLPENVTLTLRIPCVSTSGRTYISHDKARILVNGINYYDQIAGKSYTYSPYPDYIIQIQVPRNECVLIQASLAYQQYDSTNRKYYKYIMHHRSVSFTADDNRLIDFGSQDLLAYQENV